VSHSDNLDWTSTALSDAGAQAVERAGSFHGSMSSKVGDMFAYVLGTHSDLPEGHHFEVRVETEAKSDTASVGDIGSSIGC
jgi:hypothetical protein